MSYNHNMTKAVIYTRVSTDEQVTNFSLGFQKEECEKYAKNKEWQVINYYREEGASAKTVAGRPILLELIKYCQKKENSGMKVIVYKYDRWARNTSEGLGVISLLAKNGVEVVSATEPAANNAIGKAMTGILLVMAELDNNIKSERTTDGMMAAFEKGNWPWHAPIGYTHGTVNNRKALIVIPPFKKILAQLFYDAATGLYSKSELADMLNRNGFKQLYGSLADTKMVSRIISKSFYYGMMYAHTWKMNSRGNHEVIIDEITWKKANNFIVNGSIPYKEVFNQEFPLKKFLLCFSCRMPMTASLSTGTNKKYAYYHCARKQCTEHDRVPKKEAEESFKVYLNEFTISETQALLLKATLLNKLEEKVKLHESRILELNSKLDSMAEYRANIIKANAKLLLTDEETSHELEKVRTEVMVTNLELGESKYDVNESNAIIEFAHYFVTNIGGLWENFDLPRKRYLQKKIFPNGIYYTNGKFGTNYISAAFQTLKLLKENNYPLVTPREVESRLPE